MLFDKNSIKEKIIKEFYTELKNYEKDGLRFDYLGNQIDIFLDNYRDIDSLCGKEIAWINFDNNELKVKTHISHYEDSVRIGSFFVETSITNCSEVVTFVNWYKTLLQKR